MNIDEQNTTIAKISEDEKLKYENLQLKIKICELSKALASAELHIYETEYQNLLTEK